MMQPFWFAGPTIASHLLYVDFLLSLFFDSEDGGDMFPLEHQLTFNRLHVVISPKTEFFMTTALRTPNLTFL
jgi:hypothetical protein